MNFPDDALMAFVDGELDASAARSIEAAIAHDADLAKRIERMRRVKGLVEQTNEPPDATPEHLLQMLRPSAAAVTDLAAARRAQAAKRASVVSRAGLWGAIAAGVALAFIAGRTTAPEPFVTQSKSALLASGALDRALDNALAGSTGDVSLGISFRAKDGKICRTFEMAANQQSGLACNNDSHWQVRALAANEGAESGRYRQAGSAAPQILQLVDDMIAGEPVRCRC